MVNKISKSKEPKMKKVKQLQKTTQTKSIDFWVWRRIKVAHIHDINDQIKRTISYILLTSKIKADDIKECADYINLLTQDIDELLNHIDEMDPELPKKVI